MMDKVKPKKDAMVYLPWAGQCVDPVLDPELFSRLPGWRQRERLFIRKMVESYTPFTLYDVLRAGAGDVIEDTVVSLPSSLTLDSLRFREGGSAPGNILTELQERVTQEDLFAHCTALGEGRRLLKEKPAHGLFAYLWALVLVRTKLLTALPLPYFWELEEGIHALTGRRVSSRSSEAGPLLSWLDKKADLLAANIA